MSPVVNAVIAAAGLGSRLGHGMPKAMIEVGGQTLLSRMIKTLQPLVPNIYVVIGYREELIIDHCARHHPKVVLVRNPDFRTTNTAQSYAKAGEHLHGKTLFVDGDIIVSPESIRSFLERATGCSLLIGLTEPLSEDAVYARIDATTEGLTVLGFSRSTRSKHEWANLVVGPPNLLEGAEGYVFERLLEHLPSPAGELVMSEVDTQSDLERSIRFVTSL